MVKKETGTPNDDRNDKNYDRVITLIQYYVQLFWLVFGAFLLSETVLLGGIASVAKDGHDEWVFAGALFGFILCIPWWTSFQYNHAFYQLRINEAKTFEPAAGRFFLNGQDLFDGKVVLKVSIPKYAIKLRPKKSVSFLIIMFALAFLSIAIVKNPWCTFNSLQGTSPQTKQVPILKMNEPTDSATSKK